MPEVATSDGARIHYDVHGAGPPVVFLHGALAAGGAFRGQVAALSDRFRVVLVDQRGHGRSSPLAGPVSMDRFVADAREVVAALGGHAHVVGASMGGLVAARLAQDHSDAVDALVLMSTPARPDEGWMAFFAQTPPDALPLATQRLARHWHGEDWPALARALFGHFADPPPDAFAVRPKPRRALVLQATDDELLDARDAEAWVERIDAPAEARRVAGGHAFFADGREGTRAANRALRDFLAPGTR